MNNDEFQLTLQQKAAVEYWKGPSIISAGPGSGKTRTLTAKAAQLIQMNYPTDSLLAITFTNKANKELTERLVKYTGFHANSFPNVRTCHSWCVQILKAFGHKVGLAAPFSILSIGKHKAACQVVLQSLRLDPKDAYDIINTLSLAKISGDPIQYISRENDKENLRRIYDAHEELLLKQNAVHFDGILLHTRNILRDFEDVREIVKNSYSYILVDEYQDWNNIQNEILSYVVNSGNITVVGDVSQSIYGFRGANPSHFFQFNTRYPNAVSFRLDENFRCSEVIVNAANSLISNNRNQIYMPCFSRKQGPLIDVIGFMSSGAEAHWIAQQCRAYLVEYGIPFEGIGILARNKSGLRDIERTLVQNNVPFTKVESNNVYDTHLKVEEFVEDNSLPIEDGQATNKGAIHLSTIHAAKGLGYEVVFIVATEQGVLPDYRSIRNQPSEQSIDLEEERRLMFVAMTRCATNLIITYSRNRDNFYKEQSMFINELPPNLIKHSNIK